MHSPHSASGTMIGIAGEGRVPSSPSSLPMSASAGQSAVPHGDDDPTSPDDPIHPGDDAPEGTPGTGENFCPRCSGSGRIAGGPCPDCDGTGKVTSGIGGG